MGGLDVETMTPGDPAFPVLTAEESRFFIARLPQASELI